MMEEINKIKLIGEVSNSEIFGPGIRRLFLMQDNGNTHGKEFDIDELVRFNVEYINTNNKDQSKPKITGITICDPFLQPIPAITMIKLFKKHKIDIWCYSSLTFDEIADDIESLTHFEWYELLTNIDVLVDGKFNVDLANENIKYRNSLNQRIIDVKKTLRLNDGYIYLASYFHLQDYNQTRYKFGEWCRVNVNIDERRIKDLFKYLGLRDDRKNREIEVTNDISIMINILKKKGTVRGCNTKNLNKLRYLHNRWCHKVILREKRNENYLTMELIKREDYTITIGDIVDKMVKVKKPRKKHFPKKSSNKQNIKNTFLSK